MKHNVIYLITIVSFSLLSGCIHYKSKPLTEQVVQQQQEMPSPEQFNIQASQIKHPLLKPIAFNLQDGLSPDEAAILAVLRNPELRSARDHHGIANAQLLQAGLLPNPRLSYNFSAPAWGLTQGKVNGFGLGLDWEVTSLITQSNQVNAANAEQQSVDLQIAWQEWQIALAAKIAAYQLIVYTQQQALLDEMQQRLESDCLQVQQAADRGLVTEAERMTAIVAKDAIDSRLQTLTQQKNLQQQRVNRALGFKPEDTVMLQKNITLTDLQRVPGYNDLIDNLEKRRLDLMALQQGYLNQEEQLHIAVLQQFPKISIGFTPGKNNSEYYTMGAGISVSLPLFDQNQGQIALNTATRQQLFDEYANRVFQTKADIAELLETITALNKQIQLVLMTLPELENLLNTFKTALATRQIDTLNYHSAWNHWTDKKIELLTLQLQLVEARIALEIATGIYHL